MEKIIFLITLLLTGCFSNTQGMNEYNVATTSFPTSVRYKSGIPAVQTDGNTVSFYTPGGVLAFKAVPDKRKLLIYNPEAAALYWGINPFYYTALHPFLYALPAKVITGYVQADGPSGTSTGTAVETKNYNAAGLLLSVIKGTTTASAAFEYNINGQLLWIIANGEKIIQNTFDAQGQLVKHYDKYKNITEVYEYDEKGRVMSSKITQAGKPTQTTLYTYDAAGRCVLKTTDAATTTYSYTKEGQLKEKLCRQSHTTSDKVETTFEACLWAYNTDGTLHQEEASEYAYNKTKKYISGQWQNLTPDAQKKEALLMYEKSKDQIFLQGTVTVFTYEEGLLQKAAKRTFNYQSDGHTVGKTERTDLYEETIYEYEDARLRKAQTNEGNAVVTFK